MPRLVMTVTVEMGGSIGTWKLSGQRAIDMGNLLEDKLGEPDSFVELPGRKETAEMAQMLLADARDGV